MATQPTYIYGESLTGVLNIARSRVNDLLQTPDGSPAGQQGGSTLLRQLDDDGNVFLPTQIITNAAWVKFQKALGNQGYRRMIGDNLIISNLTPNVNPDPAIESWISWNGYYDGSTFETTPVLPEDFLAPLTVHERQSGQNSVFRLMVCSADGLLPSQQRSLLNRQWEWRDGGLYFPGALGLVDINLRYIKKLPKFEESGEEPDIVPWYDQTIPIPYAESPLAWYIAYEVCVPRMGEAAAAGILQNAEGEMRLLFNDQARADQRTNVRRNPRRGSHGSSWWY